MDHTSVGNAITLRMTSNLSIRWRVNNYEKDDNVYTIDYVWEDEDLINKHLPEEPKDQSNLNNDEIGSSNTLDSSNVVPIAQADTANKSSLDVVETPVTTKTPL
ncbi:hypothetical protein PIB30_064438 [Stylosanthes scabra]|uniref:Uncharacterized protein n=1 Tax=Stylosanthes scabra TaxID=79078 RepID=A0ABU6RM05_9FABA|nr:hypothetical protein [Stylosanthes scabra]